MEVFNILYFLYYIQCVFSENDFFTLIGTECLTNSSSALSSNFPIQYSKNDEEKSQFYYENKFFSTSLTGLTENDFGNWREINSLNEKSVFVTDRRWEDFETYFTKFNNRQLEYRDILDIPSENINIPISIRAKYEAHIYLCDGKSPVYYNCYWLLISGNGGNRTALRKCPNGFIKAGKKDWPKPPCSIFQVQKNHTNQSILNERIWNHFIIELKNNQYNRRIILYKNDEEIIRYSDEKQNSYQFTNLIIHTKFGSGYWKLHKFDYLFTNQESTTDMYYFYEYYSSRPICIAFYVKMCSTCTIQFSLKSYYDNYNVLHAQEFKYITEWKEVKLFFYIRRDDYIYINVATKSDNYYSKSSQFWAIDEMRKCEKDEYRKINTRDNPCQLIRYNQTIFETPATTDQSISSTNCGFLTFGKKCIPCQFFSVNVNTCRRKKYCEIDDFTNKTRCHCTAGYEGPQCVAECPSGTYGHSCKEICKNCKDRNCDNFGTCKGHCITGYSGNKCETSFGPMFSSPLEFLDIFENEIKVRQSDFSLRDPTNETLISYTIQYKESISSNWITAEDKPFLEKSTVTINNLLPDTNYLIRALINCIGIRKCDQDESGLSYPFHTKCTPIQESDLIIIPTNQSSQLKFTINNCKLSNFEVQLTNGSYTIGPIVLSKPSQNFINLEAFTNYTIKVEHRYFKDVIIKQFTTLEGIPSEVQNVQFLSTTNSIHLQWEPPEFPNGKIIKYEIKYTFLQKILCTSNENILSKSAYTTELEITLNDTQSYSYYEIGIAAVNGRFSSGFTKSQIDTNALEFIKREELPNWTITPQETSFSIKLEHHCERLNGPLIIFVKILCKSEWCIEDNGQFQHKTKINDYFSFTTNIQPYTNYSIEFFFCRNGNDLENDCITLLNDVTTKPSTPTNVQNLSIYSKNSTTISLRWMPPYPPRGELENYIIDYCGNSNSGKFTKPEKCKLWPEFHCGNIKRIQSYKNTVCVYAFNKYIPTGSSSYKIDIDYSNFEPEPPYDLVLIPSNNNNIILSWKHPNNTNGLLKKFKISINEENLEYNIKSEEDYNLTYSKTFMNNLEICCTLADIKIKSINENSQSTNTHIKYYLPPFIADFQNSSTYSTTNKTITFNLPSMALKTNTATTVFVFLSENPDIKYDFHAFAQNRTKIINNSAVQVYNNNTWNTFPMEIVLGDNSTLYSDYFNAPKINEALTTNKNYYIKLMIISECNKKINYRVVDFKILTEPSSEITQQTTYIIIIVVGAFIICVLIFLYIYGKNILKHYPTLFLDIARSIRRQTPSQTANSSRDDLILNNVQPVKPKRKPPTELFRTQHSKPIQINDFEEYLKSSLKNDELTKQHNLFPRGQTKPWTCGIKPENKSKNRYKNLIAYDHTRVILKKINDDPNSDYINANYIDGYRVRKAYIATQGPKQQTLYDFWRMVLQENVHNIIMLANVYENEKKKVEKYWPDINEELDFNDIRVKFFSHEIYANFQFKTFIVTSKNLERKVNHLHFTTWPDHGVPLYPESLVPFLQRLMNIPNSTKMPILIHCSAGVGRTGTIIICDICLRMAANEGRVDFLSALEHIRSQRPNLVDNVEQYKLAHLAVLSCLRGLETSIPCDELMGKTIQKIFEENTIATQMNYLQNTFWQEEAMKSVAYSTEDLSNFPEKDRFSSIVPENVARIFLSRYPIDDPTSSYINAVIVDGFCSPARYIATQNPLPNTIGDFWRLVVERKSTVILSLNDIDPTDETCCKFWPDEDTPILQPVDYITLKYQETTGTTYFSMTTVQMHLHNEPEFIPIEIVSLNNCWPPNQTLPDLNIQDFLTFWEESDRICRQSEPVILTCYNGATACGLYLALSFSIEKMKLEQICDICQAVRCIRRNRKEFVTHQEQFEFLYNASLKYIKGFQQYANFN